jgi:hypothetical protein
MHYYNRHLVLEPISANFRIGGQGTLRHAEVGFESDWSTAVSDAELSASGSDPYLDVPPEVFIARLETYERVLVDLKEHLYEGSWERILDDLRARLDNKPYIYKLSQTISRDVAAIERMKSYEMRQKVSLSALLRKNSA